VGALPPVRSTFETSPLLTPMLHRYMGGTTIDSALTRLRELTELGCLATMHVRLGPVVDAEGAERYVQEYLSFVAALVDQDVQKGHELSVKLEQLGYKTPQGLDLALANLHRVADAAYSAAMRLTVDMEGVEEVDDTLAAVADVRRTHADVGIVLQANLRRTEDDCRALAYPGSRVRLVKGGYFVTDETGYRRRADVDRSYVRCLRILMEGPGYPMVATHDDRMIDIAHELARRAQRTSDDYEFQMLAGAREGRQGELVARGDRVRAYFAYGPEWFPWMVWIVSEKPSKLLSILKGAVTG